MGGSVQLPCRAQGRPKPRIIWDRIGGSAASQSHHHHQMGGKLTQYFEKETPEDLLAKAKIMSLRSKRSILKTKQSVFHSKHQTIALMAAGKSALAADRSRRTEQRHHTFNQIMRDESDEIVHKSLRRKRQVATSDGRIDDINVNENDEDGSPEAIPILVFSTQAPSEVSRLQVTDNGELILIDVTERDEVCKFILDFVCACVRVEQYFKLLVLFSGMVCVCRIK